MHTEEKIKMYNGQCILVMVQNGVVTHYDGNFALPHVEFVKRKTSPLPEDAWVGSVTKADDEIMGISSKYFYDYQMPAPKEIDAALKAKFE